MPVGVPAAGSASTEPEFYDSGDDQKAFDEFELACAASTEPEFYDSGDASCLDAA